MADQSSSRFVLPVVLALAALLFSANIWGYDLWPADEPRFAEVAREMMQSGDYLAPHVNGEPYREKPPLLFWSIAAVSRPFGEVNEWTARIPSVLAALATLACTWSLARRLYGTRVAFWSCIVLATCTRFWWQARTVQIDMLLTACLSVALLSFWRWHQERPAVVGPPTRNLALFYAAIALALLAKGPPGLVFPSLLVATFYWKRPAERRKTHWAIGVLCAIAIALAWLIPARMAVSGEGSESAQADIGANIFRNTIGRFFLGVSHAEMPWYYLENLPVDLLPWTLFVPYTILFVWRRRREDERMRLLLTWTVPAFIFFSVCIGKRALYLLPIFPVLAILIARSILDLAESPRAVWRRRTALVWAAILLVLAVAPFVVRYTEYAEAWNASFLAMTVAAGLFAAHTVVLAVRTDGSTFHRALAVHIGTLEVLAALIVFPAINPYKSARNFCSPMRVLNDVGVEYELYSMGFSREAYIFYSERFHTPLVHGLLEIELPEGTGIDPVKFQIEMKDALSDAVDDVAIESYAKLSQEERDALDAAVDQTSRQSGMDPAITDTFVAALRKNVEPLNAGDPALAMVQQDDYKWLLPLLPDLEAYHVLDDTSVGSRDVLLLANDAAVQALDGLR